MAEFQTTHTEDSLKSYSRKSIRNFLLWIIILAVLPLIYWSLKSSSITPVIGNNSLDSLQNLYSQSLMRNKILQDSLDSCKTNKPTDDPCRLLKSRIQTLQSLATSAEFTGNGDIILQKGQHVTLSFLTIQLISKNTDRVYLRLEDLVDNKIDTVSISKTSPYNSATKNPKVSIKLSRFQGDTVILHVSLFRTGARK